MKKVLLVDDHAFLRDALAEVMRRHFPQAVVLEAGTLQTTFDLLAQHAEVELLLLDLNLPDGNGLPALPALRLATRARIVIMSADERSVSVSAALEAGAAGYLPKTLSGNAMLAAVRHVLDGGVYVPELAFEGREGREGKTLTVPEPALSPRQREVLAWLVSGVANKVIARELDIAEATVKSHVTAIFAAFDVANRTQVVVEVARRGLRVQLQRPRQA